MPVSTQEPNDLSPSPASLAAATDHLTHLPKMSPTAGVGSQEYVAINGWSIAALLLGLISFLAIVNDYLAVVCVAGLIVAAIAVRQISRSNGTQTGRGMAMIGIFLAGTIGSYDAAWDTVQFMNTRADRAAINHLCDLFGEDMAQHAYDSAYDLFSMHFKLRVGRPEFAAALKGLQAELARQYASGAGSGPVVGAVWPGLVVFDRDPDSGVTTAVSQITLNFEHAAGMDPINATFRKSGHTWTIEGIPDLFPNSPQQQQR